MPIGISLSLSGYKRFITQLRGDLRANAHGWCLVNTPEGLVLHINRHDQYIKRLGGSFNYDLTANQRRDETHYSNMGGKDRPVTAQSLKDALETLARGGDYDAIGPHLRQVCLLASEAARSQIIYRCILKLLEGKGRSVSVADFDGLSLNYSSTKAASFINGFFTLDSEHYARNASNPKVALALNKLSAKLGRDVLG
ncbi:hypothetical protein [Nitratireductor sp. GCM10026969]|uniref:hypothetical protein n=1 Tax=Nitratireductor sp. GCM10026969 TaxID=3252645 RepID=UPI00360D4093